VPFYIFYSMFGMQRIGDLAWAAADQRARGFLLGATAGRTTLNGEGLQHGMHRMLNEQHDEYYYITLMNENYAHPDMPEGAADGIIKGMYLLQSASPDGGNTSPASGGGRNGAAVSGGGAASPKKKSNTPHVQLMGSGTILREAIAAAELLDKEFGVTADIWSCPSFNELARDGADAERWNRLHPEGEQRKPYITQLLEGRQGPAIVATDYIRAYPEQVRAFVPMRYTVLGTDGFGRSDTRANLRRFFEVDRYHIAHAAIAALAAEGKMTGKDVARAIKQYRLDVDKPNPIGV